MQFRQTFTPYRMTGVLFRLTRHRVSKMKRTLRVHQGQPEWHPSYSLSHKTVNAKENFWNVYCFAANQTRDETAKDDRQTAAGISHDLIRNNELAVFLLQEIFNIPFGSL